MTNRLTNRDEATEMETGIAIQHGVKRGQMEAKECKGSRKARYSTSSTVR